MANAEDPLTNRRRLGAESHNPTDVIATAGTTGQDRLEPGEDMFNPTAEERAEFGVQENEEVGWVRHPGIWKQHEGIDRGMQIKRAGGRVVTQNGVPVTGGLDVMMVALPKEKLEEAARADAQRQADFERHVDNQDWEGQLQPGDKESLARRVAESVEQMKQARVVGKESPTARLPMFAVEQGLLMPEEAELMESRARRGGRTPTDKEAHDEAAWAAAIQKKRDGRGRRFFSIPR
jgi:hypothetical protein